MRTFTSRETIKARKVTAKEGEYVVTANGQRFAAKGDYVVDRGEGSQDVMEKEPFETRFKAPSAPARRSASKSASPKRAGSQKGSSAAERVKGRK